MEWALSRKISGELVMSRMVVILLFIGQFSLSLGSNVFDRKRAKSEKQATGQIDIDHLQQVAQNIRAAKQSLNRSRSSVPKTSGIAQPRIAGAPKALMITRDNGRPIFISGFDSGHGQRIQSTEIVPLIKSVYGLRNPQIRLEIIDRKSDEFQNQHIRMQQTLAGIPVYGRDIFVHYDEKGQLKSMNGRLDPVGSVQTQPDISESKAIALAMKAAGFEAKATSELIVYAPEPGLHTLAFRIECVGKLDERVQFFVDAESGEILRQQDLVVYDGPVIASGKNYFDQMVSFGAYQSQSKYYMIDASKPMFDASASSLPDDGQGVIYVLDANHADETLYYINSNDVNAWAAPNAVSVISNVGIMYDYLTDRFGHLSLDGRGQTITAIVNYQSNYNNAFWNGKFLVFGNGDGEQFDDLASALDIVCHEMGHGVVEYTANLIYEFQSGALNEAYADIFGACAEFYSLGQNGDWLIGEDVTTPGVPGDALRDMAVPNSVNALDKLPIHMDEFYVTSIDDDNGGVHTNCSIVSHAFYRFASELGVAKAEKIAYHALVYYLTRTSQFIDARVSMVQAARDLYGENSMEEQTVQQAFDAVGLFGSTGSPPPDNAPAPEGEQFFLVVETGTNHLYRTNNLTDFDLISNVPVLSKPSVTDNGEYILFIGTDNNPYMMTLFGSEVTRLDNSGLFQNMVISPDGTKLAATSIYQDGYIYAIDLNEFSPVTRTLPIYTPTTSEDTRSGTAMYADVLEWSLDNEHILYDALNQAQVAGGEIWEYWDINLMRFSDGKILRVFPPQSIGINIGNPVLATNNDYIMAFDFMDEQEEVYTLGANLETGDVGQITYNGQSLSRPHFSPDDWTIIYEYTENDVSDIYWVSLASDRITGAGNDQKIIQNAKYPVWIIRGERPTTEVQQEETAKLAHSIVLYDNYPNPFNPTTTIEFEVPDPGWVELAVLDVLGREVDILINGPLHSGHHRIDFNAQQLPSGIYFYRLQTTYEMTLKKMMVLR
jgi:Zn-dependent metalloprotease